MMKQNDKIQKLFDDYSAELIPQEKLADKAVSVMKAHKKTSVKRGFSFAAFAVCFVCFVLVVSSFGIFDSGNSDKSDGNSPAAPSAPTVTYFAQSQVRGKRISVDFDGFASSSQAFLDKIKQSELIVSSERYSAYYFKDTDTPAYIRADLLIRTENGAVEVTVLLYSDGYVWRELQAQYTSYYAYGVSVQDGVTENGEYLSSSFFADASAGQNIFVMATGGSARSVSRNVVTRIYELSQATD